MIKQSTRFKRPTPWHSRQLHPAYSTETPGIKVTKFMFRLSYKHGPFQNLIKIAKAPKQHFKDQIKNRIIRALKLCLPNYQGHIRLWFGTVLVSGVLFHRLGYTAKTESFTKSPVWHIKFLSFTFTSRRKLKPTDRRTTPQSHSFHQHSASVYCVISMHQTPCAGLSTPAPPTCSEVHPLHPPYPLALHRDSNS